MEEVFQTLVTNMASFAQNVQLQTTATNERMIDLMQNQQALIHAVQQVAGQPKCPEFKMDPPTFSGKGDFREWKRNIELIYEAKGLTPEEKLTWTLPLLQESAARVATHTAPTTYRELMTALTTRFADGNDDFHCQVAMGEHSHTGSIEDYVDCLLDLSSRLPNLVDADAKYALISDLKSEIQIHLLEQAHVLRRFARFWLNCESEPKQDEGLDPPPVAEQTLVPPSARRQWSWTHTSRVASD